VCGVCVCGVCVWCVCGVVCVWCVCVVCVCGVCVCVYVCARVVSQIYSQLNALTFLKNPTKKTDKC